MVFIKFERWKKNVVQKEREFLKEKGKAVWSGDKKLKGDGLNKTEIEGK